MLVRRSQTGLVESVFDEQLMSKRGTKWRDSSAPLLSDDQTAHAQSRDFHAPGGRPPKIRKDTYVVRKVLSDWTSRAFPLAVQR